MNRKLVQYKQTNNRLRKRIKNLNEVIEIYRKDCSKLRNKIDSLEIRKQFMHEHSEMQEDAIENFKNEVKHLEKENRNYMDRISSITQENLELEGDLANIKHRIMVLDYDLKNAEEDKMNTEQINGCLRDENKRLSNKVVSLTLEKEALEDSMFKNKVKKLFRR